MRSLNLPVFSHPCLYAGNFNCCHVDWGYDDNNLKGECLAGWESINCLFLLYNAEDAANFSSRRWNTDTNPDLAFACVGPNSRLQDRRVFEKFPSLHHRPLLITPPSLLWQCQAYLLSDGTSARPNRVVTSLLRINPQRVFCRLIHFMWTRLTRTSVTSLKKHLKRLSHSDIETFIFRSGMRRVNPFIEVCCSVLAETTRVWLLQLCLPSLIGSVEIDGPRLFGASTFYTPVETYGVFLTTFTGKSRHSPRYCPVSGDVIASQLVRNKR